MKNWKRTQARVLPALLCAAALFALCGFADGSLTEPEPIDGGTTYWEDPDAPKAIESREITGFYAAFYLSERWNAEEIHDFEFRVTRGEDGVLTASEAISGVCLPADEALLSALQRVIDAYGLASRNGVYDVTAGLPPEYQERTLRVDYASGECLRFTVNNDPYAEWAEEVYTVFADWFARQGDDSLLPPKENSPLADLRFYLLENGLMLEYDVISTRAEGETPLLEKTIYDNEAGKVLDTVRIPVPEDYYARLTGILAPYDLVRRYDYSRYNHAMGLYSNHDLGYFGMGDARPDGTEADAEELFLLLYLEYESGTRLHIETRKASEIAGMRPLLADLCAYYDALFG